MRNHSPALYILGDIGYLNSNLQSLVNRINVFFKPSDKVILLGDNFYNKGPFGPGGIFTLHDCKLELFKDIFQCVGFDNIYAVMGNHDYEGNPTVQLQSPYIKNNEYYFKMSLSENTDLFFIDTVQLYENHCNIGRNKIQRAHNESDYKILQTKQIEWLTHALHESVACNKIVFGHYPIISNGIYKDLLSPLYNKLLPIFAKYNVSAYVSGHEHNIQYIERNINGYRLRQFIVGSSSQNRMFITRNILPNDMFDNSKCFYMKIYEDEELITLEIFDNTDIPIYKYVF